jgi:transposase-like protein
VCDNCAINHCSYCGRCGAFIFIEDGVYNRKLESYVCDSCNNILKGEKE